MESSESNKNKKIGLAFTLGLHGALFLLFFFLFAWKAPENESAPGYGNGIELNFGMDDQGGGDIQPLENTAVAEATEEPLPGEINSEASENQEEVQESQEQILTQTEKSDAVVVEKKVADKPAPETKKETVKTPEKEAKVVEKTGAAGETGKSLYPNNSSHGDDPGVKGDKGDPEGKIDANALYGNPGSGGNGGNGGTSIEMSGWKADFQPKPKDEISNENGRIVFEIKIDGQGEIISVKTLEKTVGPAVEKIYKEEVQRLTFSKTTSNSQSASISTGKITFIIRAQ